MIAIHDADLRVIEARAQAVVDLASRSRIAGELEELTIHTMLRLLVQAAERVVGLEECKMAQARERKEAAKEAWHG